MHYNLPGSVENIEAQNEIRNYSPPPIVQNRNKPIRIRKKNLQRRLIKEQQTSFIFSVNLGYMFFNKFSDFLGLNVTNQSYYQRYTSGILLTTSAISLGLRFFLGYLQEGFVNYPYNKARTFYGLLRCIIVVIRSYHLYKNRRYLKNIITECFENISAPLFLKPQVENFQIKFQKGHKIQKVYWKILLLIASIINIIFLIKLVVQPFIHYNGDFKITIFLFLRELLLFYGAIGFLVCTLVYITHHLELLSMLCKILDHLNDVILTLDKLPELVTPESGLHQDRVHKTLRYVVQTHQRAIRLYFCKN
jgi:hypothetical protein